MELRSILKSLKKVLSKKRYIHSVNVMKEAVSLARHYHGDIHKALLAGILHDCGKYIKNEEAKSFVSKIGYQADAIELEQTELLHGVIGAHLAKTQYTVDDPEILSAIQWHTTGKPGMTLIEKIIFVADYIEPARSFEGVEVMRALAYNDLDRCMVLCANSTIAHVLGKGLLLHPNTIETRNFTLLGLK